MLLSVAIDIALNPKFIFGFGPVPRLPISGLCACIGRGPDSQSYRARHPSLPAPTRAVPAQERTFDAANELGHRQYSRPQGHLAQCKIREADTFAARHAGAEDLPKGLVKLYRDNATTPTPDGLYSAFYYSHPLATERIARLRRNEVEVDPLADPLDRPLRA